MQNQHTWELISAQKTSHNVPLRFIDDVPVVEFIYLVFTRMPGDSYRRRLGSLLLWLCDVFSSAN